MEEIEKRQGLLGGVSTVARAIGWGAVVGMAVPLVATALYLQLGGREWSLHHVWFVQRSSPSLWLLDVVPLVIAALAGLSARARLSRMRLAAHEQRLGFDALARITQHAIVVADATDQIVEWSPGAEDLFGYSATEVIGLPLSRLIALSHHEALEAEIARTRRELDRHGRLVLQGQKNDGRPVSIVISLAAWQARTGQMLGAVLHDISKQVLAERRLGEVQTNWRDIAENSSDVLLLLDRASTIIFANRSLLDEPLERVIGNSVSELVPDLREVIEPALKQVFEAGSPYQIEARVTTRDGQPRWWWCRFAPQREDGDVVQAVLSISDIGDRIETDLALRRLAGIVERTTDAVLTTGIDGKIQSWNPGAEVLWGWKDTEIIGRDLAILCPPELLDEQLRIFARLRDGLHVHPYDSFGLAKSGQRIAVSISVAATLDEKVQFQGISAVVRDRSRHQELQDALHKAKSFAETANQLKSEFLANMSHEVRTPLNGVVGMVDLLRSTPMSPVQASYVATLLEATQALRVIVDDVLDFSKIEAGQLKIESVEFDLVPLIGSVVDMFQQTAAQNATELQLEMPEDALLRVVGDPTRIRQVLVNLLNNAVKFTRNGGVGVRCSAREGAGLRVAVRVEIEDSGVGISSEAQALIFQPFSQADGSITRRFGGTGLGLSICHKIMGLMGGKIGFKSELGVGSTFWFEIEFDKAMAPSPRQGTPHSAALSKSKTSYRILVAEDNAINQTVVSAMLQGLGCSVQIVKNGREALEQWEAGSYDLILMDCQMPIMSGFEATVAIRTREKLGDRRIPIIAMTAQAYAQDRERCTQAGMDDHLAKPLTRAELKTTLAQWLPLDAQAPLVTPATPKGITIDTQMLERLESELGDGGKEMLADLIEGFFLDFQQTLGRLAREAALEQWQRVAFEAHRLRSSTANLAAVDLTLLCKDLEESGQQGDAGRTAELLLLIDEEYARARDALTAYVRCQSTRTPEVAVRDIPTVSLTGETNSVPN